MSGKVVDNITVAKNAIAHLYKPVSQRKLKDYQPFFDSLHEDAVLQYAAPEGASEIRGRQTVIDYVRSLFTSLAGPELDDDTELETPLEFFSNGDRVVALWKECKRNKRTGARSNSKEVALIHEFREGQIVRLLRFNT